MKRAVRIGLTTVLTMETLSALAWAGKAHDTDPASESWTGVSGKEAPEQHTASVTAEYYALRSVTIHDYDQRACLIEVRQGSLNGGAGAALLDKLKLCEPRVAQAWKNLDVGAGRFISSIQVCTSARSGAPAIRGVRVQSSSVGADGKLKTDGAPIEIRFVGCQTWHKRRACPKGAVATALRAHYIEGAQGYTGLELRCHSLRDVEASPAAD